MFGVDPAFMNVLDINTPAAQSKYGWIDWIDWQYYANLTVFQSYRDDCWVIIKGCVQWNPVYGWKGFRLQ